MAEIVANERVRFNRTFLVLKFSVYEYKRAPTVSFNRTFLVLKWLGSSIVTMLLSRFNRTFLVLKLREKTVNGRSFEVLIAPFWY